MRHRDLKLNGFRIELSSQTVMAQVKDVASSAEMAALRRECGPAWFLYWDAGRAYALPNVSDPPPFGEATTLEASDHLKLLAARISDVLPDKFPGYEAFRRRPFTIIGQRDELVGAIRRKLSGLSHIVNEFKIEPKFELHAKLVEMADGDFFIGLFMEVRTRWTIHASLDALQDAGVDLRGLYVVRRNPAPGERAFAGRIDSIANSSVTLTTADGATTMNTSAIRLEGSRASFVRCLRPILGPRYEAFEDERKRLEAEMLGGPALEKLLDRMGTYLREASPIDLGGGLTCAVTERITGDNTAAYESVLEGGPVEYCFDAARTKRDTLAWRGLTSFGPFSRETFPKRTPTILALFPESVQGPVERFLRYLRDGISELRDSRYASGFAGTFRLTNPRFRLERIALSGNGANVADAYRTAVERALGGEADLPDTAIVIVAEDHARLPDGVNPYLHAKALLLLAGVPAQVIRVPTVSQDAYSLQFILQDIAIALYAKMGGTPWTVNHDLTINDEIVIGMGTVELSESRFHERQRFVGITTVFRGDGNYLLANVSRECSYAEYPTVLRQSIVETLRDIKIRNGWQRGDTVRIVFHAYKPLKNVETEDIIANAVRSLQGEQHVEFAFLTVTA